MQGGDLFPHSVRGICLEFQSGLEIEIRGQEELDGSIFGEAGRGLDELEREPLQFFRLNILRQFKDEHAETGELVVLLSLDVEVVLTGFPLSRSAGLNREGL